MLSPTGLEPITFLYERNVITILTMSYSKKHTPRLQMGATGVEPAKNKF